MIGEFRLWSRTDMKQLAVLMLGNGYPANHVKFLNLFDILYIFIATDNLGLFLQIDKTYKVFCIDKIELF